MDFFRRVTPPCFARSLAFLGLLLAAPLMGMAQSPAPEHSPAATNGADGLAAPASAEDRGWPRDFEAADSAVRVYQPQLESWHKFDRIAFRAAVAIGAKGTDERAFGTIVVSADTDVAFDERLVVLSNKKIEKVNFPDVEPAEATRLSGILQAALPADRPQTISLDRIIAGMPMDHADVRTVDVSVAPPRIFTSDKPAVLVIFMGKPRFKPVPQSDLLFAINTNWDVFMDPAGGKYYLLYGKCWLVTSNLQEGPWAPAASPPPSLLKLPIDENWSDVRAAIPGEPSRDPPIVFVSNEPAELIVTRGAPELEPLVGTGLMLVANSDNDLFYHTGEKQYYFLAAGRWFKAPTVAGPWAATSGNLPPDFKQIPDDAEAADVLASVPGTPEANEAVILASIPRKATISRSEVSVNVVYNGAPDFRAIESTTVKYAHNTPYNVFLVDGGYYCCHDAVWFVAAAPTGPWAVCDAVPKAIYTIPASSPMHNVTYVTVYESTPTTVVTGYSAGYSGSTVAATGVVMFGLGVLVGAAIADNDDCCWSFHCHPGYFSYGCGSIYVGHCGGYVCGARHYGPYGGAGRWASYNPATGVYSRGAYAYGPSSAAGYRAAYNPSTGVASYRAGGSNVYGSWGRGAVTNGDEWLRGGYRSGARGAVGGVQGSGGAGAIHAEGRFGNGITIARDRDGDIYAGKDGNVYRRTDGGWDQQRSSARTQAAAPSATGAGRPPAQAGDLQRDSFNRDRGNRNATRTSQFQRSGSHATPARGGGRRR